MNNVGGWSYDRKAERVANPENRCVTIASATKKFVKRQKKFTGTVFTICFTQVCNHLFY